MRTSHKAKDAAAEKQSYVCDTFTCDDKAHQPPLPGTPVCVFPVMLLGKAREAPRPIWGSAMMTQSVTARKVAVRRLRVRQKPAAA